MKEEKSKISSAQWKLAGLLAIATVIAIYYRFLIDSRLAQTAAFYVGLPALLAILLTLTPKAKSAYGMAIKGVTIALLASTILIGEGFICILFSAPIFYVIALMVTYWVQALRNGDSKTEKTINGLILLPILLMSMEGLTSDLSFNRDETVVAQQLIYASSEEIEIALASAQNFEQGELPTFLALGFPFPTQMSGSGMEVGDQRVVGYQNDTGESTQLVFEVVENRPNYLRFRPVVNSTVFADWLDIGDSEISWQASEDGATEVEWTIHYQRLLDPYWYFAPIERYAMNLVADYLISSLAQP